MKDKTFLVTGSAGQLGKEFQRIIIERGMCCIAPAEDDCDITNSAKVEGIISRINPDFIINCAAYNAVDEAEEKSDLAHLVNTKAVENLAEFCKKHSIFLIHYSSDYVFDGEKQDFYTEDDTPNPLNIYGKSKLNGEEIIQECMSDYLIFRLSWVIGQGKQNFLYKLSSWAAKNRVLKISSDEVSVPTYTEDIVNFTLLSLEKSITGLFHLTNSGYASRYELAKYFIRKMGLGNIVVPVSMSSFKTKARRPLFAAMSNERISNILKISYPSWEDGIDRYIEVLRNKDIE